MTKLVDMLSRERDRLTWCDAGCASHDLVQIWVSCSIIHQHYVTASNPRWSKQQPQHLGQYFRWIFFVVFLFLGEIRAFLAILNWGQL